MLGIVFAFPILLIAASAMAQSPKVEPPVSSASSVQRVAAPLASVPEGVAPASRGDDERRQEDARRRAIFILLLKAAAAMFSLLAA